MSIQGFHKLSTVDYPKNPCSVLFHGGCNFKCPYCHNRSLVNEESPPLNRRISCFNCAGERSISNIFVFQAENQLWIKLYSMIYNC